MFAHEGRRLLHLRVVGRHAALQKRQRRQRRQADRVGVAPDAVGEGMVLQEPNALGNRLVDRLLLGSFVNAGVLTGDGAIGAGGSVISSSA